jgi:hypothetical protein
LRFEVGAVITNRNDLHPPEPCHQDQQTPEHRDGQVAQVRIVLFELIKNQHVEFGIISPSPPDFAIGAKAVFHNRLVAQKTIHEPK